MGDLRFVANISTARGARGIPSYIWHIAVSLVRALFGSSVRCLFGKRPLQAARHQHTSCAIFTVALHPPHMYVSIT